MRADPNHNYYAKPHNNTRGRGHKPANQGPDRSRGALKSRADKSRGGRGRGTQARHVPQHETPASDSTVRISIFGNARRSPPHLDTYHVTGQLARDVRSVDRTQLS